MIAGGALIAANDLVIQIQTLQNRISETESALTAKEAEFEALVVEHDKWQQSQKPISEANVGIPERKSSELEGLQREKTEPVAKRDEPITDLSLSPDNTEPLQRSKSAPETIGESAQRKKSSTSISPVDRQETKISESNDPVTVPESQPSNQPLQEVLQDEPSKTTNPLSTNEPVKTLPDATSTEGDSPTEPAVQPLLETVPPKDNATNTVQDVPSPAD